MGRAVACEILTSGWCPFNCEYCYIPKTPAMKSVHQNIVKWLQDEEYITKLSQIVGDRLEHLSFWGCEPLLTTNILSKSLGRITATFPKLKEISFSTSMMMVEPLVEFLKVAASYDIVSMVQISLDGPAFITDKNRSEGMAEQVPENFFKVLEQIQDCAGKGVHFRWKSTLSIDNIREMVCDQKKIVECGDYFQHLGEEFGRINQNELITLSTSEFVPGLVVPGRYTCEDGRMFAEFLRGLRENGLSTTYTHRLKKVLELEDELGIKRSMFTCSGGDSNMGLGENVHICHRTFYFDHDEYINSVLELDSIKNWDVSHLERRVVDMIRSYYIIDPDDKVAMARFSYVMRNYHDFWKMKIQTDITMLWEMALVGQASEAYLHNQSLSELFSLFIQTGVSCQMENLLNTGSAHLIPLSLLRMFANGAFEEIMLDVKRIHKVEDKAGNTYDRK